MQILLKRAYDTPAKSDGFRVLVDRVWPRGMSKRALRLDLWAKDVAPSTALRQWFGHDPKRWAEFKKRYKAELRTPHAVQCLDDALEQASGAPAITLVYGARDEQHNQAVVLREIFERLTR